MTFDEWKHVVAIAATLWRGREAPLDGAQLGHWYQVEFHRHAVSDVDGAFSALARRQDFFPSLAQLQQATREVAEARQLAEEQAARGKVLHLTPPPTRTVAQRVRVSDEAAAQWRQEQTAELQQFARRYGGYGMDGDTLAARLAQLDEPGPFARRAREVIAGRATPGVGIDAMLPSLDGAEKASSDAADDRDGDPPSVRSA
jgi:hypothetical protein